MAPDGILENQPGEKRNTWLWMSGCAISSSSFLFGYSLAALNTCIASDSVGSILNDIQLSTHEQELATSFTIIGAWIGSLLAGGPADKVGRRSTLLANNIIFIVGAFCCAQASDKYWLYAGRTVMGLATGVACIVPPILLTEIAPSNIRGSLTSLHQLAITIGILFAGLLGWVFVQHFDHGWRYVNAFAILPAVLQICVARMVPESPRWLSQNGHTDQARSTLKWLYADPSDVEDALLDMKNTLRSSSEADQNGSSSWSQLRRYSGIISIGFGLVFFQAMCGVNTVIFYSGKVFEYAGVHEAIAATVSVGLVNVLSTVGALFLIDRYGRTTLLRGGASIMFTALAVIAFVLLLGSAHPQLQGAAAVTFTLLYITGFAVSFGSVTWVVLGEILPTSVRSKAMSFLLSMNWMMNLIIATASLSVIKAFGGGDSEEDQKRGVAYLFGIYCAIVAMSYFFVSCFVPETKGVVLDAQRAGQKIKAQDYSSQQESLIP